MWRKFYYVLPLIEQVREIYFEDGKKDKCEVEYVLFDRAKSILLVGETGCGKTTLIKILLSQIDPESNEPCVIFDYKGDYVDHLSDTRDLVVLSSRGSSHVWNLFNEAESDADFDELSYELFPSEKTYWERAARQVTADVMAYLHREVENPSNEDLVRFLRSESLEDIHGSLASYEDLRGSATHVDPKSPKQALGVWSTIQTRIRESLVGDFSKRGDFSVRDYFEDPDSRFLILRYDIQRGASVIPAFRLLLDQAVKRSLVNDNRRKYLVADEFQNLPKLRMLERLVNAGRSFSAESIIGTQSVAQVFHNYSRDYARALLGGLPNKILMRSGDDETTRFERDSIARVQSGRKYEPWEDPRRYGGQKEMVTEHYPVSEEELRNLNEGECVIIKPKSWVKCQLKGYLSAVEGIDNLHGKGILLGAPGVSLNV